MKKQLISIASLPLCIALAACNDTIPPPTQPSPPAVMTSEDMKTPSHEAPPVSPEASPAKASDADDLRGLELDGTRIVKAEHGDLNADGRPDVLVVLDRRASTDTPGEHSLRTVQLLLRAAEGHLQAAAQNDKIIPCGMCAGLGGDPFSFARIDKDGFTLVTEGGSREHWWNSYTFRYVAERAGWFLDKVQRGVTDTGADKTLKIDLTERDFGTVSFDAFDPETLPAVELP